MRVLQLNTWVDKVGGAEIYMHLVIDALREAGHQVGVFGFSPDREVDEPELRVIQRPEYEPQNLFHDERQSKAVQEFARRFEPDLIHAHNLSAYPASFALALRELCVPMVQTVHDFSLMCPNSWCVWPDGTVCPGGAGKKCWEHGCESNYPYDARQVVAGHVRLDVVKSAFDAFPCPSQFLADKLTDHGYEHAEGLPLWVELEGKEPPQIDVGDRHPNQILFVGRLVPEKGVRYLVEAMPHVLKENPAAELHVVGGGPELEPLKALAGELGLGASATFHGRVPHERVQEFFSKATVQVLPSIWCENSPMTTYESFISGLPMVASRIAGLPAMVREGETGLLAEPRDPADLARALLNVLSDRELQATLQKGCRAALERYSRKNHLDRLFAIYEEAKERFQTRTRPEPRYGDPDLIASMDALYGKYADVEKWALDMKGHIDYLESTGDAGQPVQRFGKHLIYMAKSKVRRWRER